MARIRSVKPEIWLSPQVMNLSMEARLLFIGLITQADDAGRGSADPRRIKAAIFGGDDVTSADVRRWLDEVSEQRLATLYETPEHGILYELPSWKAHQSIDRPRQSAYPGAQEAASTAQPRRSIVEPSTRAREGSEGRKEGNGREGSEGAYARARETDAIVPRESNLAELAPDADPEALADWLAHRQALGKPLRDHEVIAVGKTLRAIGDGPTQRATVRNCVANGWRNLRIADGVIAAPTAQTWTPPDDDEEPQRAQA